MEIIEEQLLELAYLMLRKAKIEKKLRQTFKCILRKLFSCCGMKNIELELQKINEAITELNKNNKKKLVRSSSI
jgi:hypothetical protein